MRFSRRPKIEPKIPNSSLADMAFLLLIFFLVNTTIDRDGGITLTLPAKGAVKQVAAENIAQVAIDNAGGVYLNDEMVAIKDLAILARGLQAKNPNIIFSVQSSPATAYKYYIAVLDQLRAAQVARIAISETDRF